MNEINSNTKINVTATPLEWAKSIGTIVGWLISGGAAIIAILVWAGYIHPAGSQQEKAREMEEMNIQLKQYMMDNYVSKQRFYEVLDDLHKHMEEQKAMSREIKVELKEINENIIKLRLSAKNN